MLGTVLVCAIIVYSATLEFVLQNNGSFHATHQSSMLVLLHSPLNISMRFEKDPFLVWYAVVPVAVSILFGQLTCSTKDFSKVSQFHVSITKPFDCSVAKHPMLSMRLSILSSLKFSVSKCKVGLGLFLNTSRNLFMHVPAQGTLLNQMLEGVSSTSTYAPTSMS